MLQPQQQTELNQSAADGVLELPFQLALRDPQSRRDIWDTQRLKDILLDQAYCLADDGDQRIGAMPHGPALRSSCRAHRVVHQLIRNFASQTFAMRLAYQAQHQINTR